MRDSGESLDDDPADVAVPDEVARAVLASGDLDELERLYDTMWYHLPALYGPEVLRAIVGLPQAELERRPRLLIAGTLAHAFTRSTWPEHFRVLEFHSSWGPRSIALWPTLEKPGDLIAAGGTAFLAARMAGDFDRSDVIATELESRLRESGVDTVWGASSAGRDGWIANQKSLTALLAGDDSRAMTEILRSYREATGGVYQEWLLAAGAGQIALLAVLQGHRPLALEWLAKHEGMPLLPHIAALALLPENLARAHLAMDALDQQDAERYLAKLVPSSDQVELWPFVAAARARFGRLFGDARAALAELEEARFSHGLAGRHWDIAGFVLARAKADLLLVLGDLDGALALRRRYPRAATLLVPAAVVALRSGDAATAEELARRGLSGEASPRDALSLQLVLAAAQLRAGDSAGAARTGAAAFARAEAQRDRSALLLLSTSDLEALLRVADEANPLAGIDVARPDDHASAEIPRPDIDGTPLPSAGRVWRERIAERLNEQARLIIIRAEGGAGKTALAADWIERHRDDGAAVIWVPFDDTCRSLPSVWHRIASALQGRGWLQDGDVLSTYLAGGVPVADIPSLVVDQVLASGRRVRVVFDDVHLLDDDAQESLVQVIERVQLVTAMVTERTRTRFDDPALLARTGAVTIESTELAATASELRELGERGGVELSDDQVARLLATTAGNMLAVRVAIAELGRVTTTARPSAAELEARVARATRRAILPRFATEADRDAAYRLALAPSVDPALAVELTHRDDVDRLLDAFQRDGLGEYRDDPAAPTFVFHVLVAEALRAEALRTVPDDELTELRRLVARHLLAAGDTVAAIGIMVQLGDYDSVWPAIVRDFSEVTLHRVDDVARILGTVPTATLEAHATLAISLAVMMSERESTTSVRIRRLVDAGVRGLQRLAPTTNPLEEYLRLIARFAALRVARKYDEASAAGGLAITHLQAVASSTPTVGGADLSIGILQVTITEVLAGRLATAIDHANLLAHGGHAGRESHRLALLAEAHALQGDMDQVEAALIAGDAVEAPEWKRSIFTVAARVAHATLLTERGDPRAALAVLDGIGERLAQTEHWPYVLAARAVARLAAGQALIGIDELGLALRRFRGRGASAFALARVSAIRADLYLATGRPDRALSILDGAGEDLVLVLSRTRLTLASGDAGAALRVLESADWEEAPPRQAAEMLLLSGILHRRLGHERAAGDAFARAERILSISSLVMPLAMVPRVDLIESGLTLPTALELLDDPFRSLAERPRLTPREQEVLAELVVTGSTDDIAQHFHVSQNTVKSQLKSIYRKLGVSTRSEAIEAARRHGLL